MAVASAPAPGKLCKGSTSRRSEADSALPITIHIIGDAVGPGRDDPQLLI